MEETKEKNKDPKEDIKREDLNYSMLRRVIIRADFTSMLNTGRIVDALNEQDWFKGAFNNYSRLRYTETPQSQETDPKEEWEPRFIRRFDECNIGSERNITLDITNESVCMDIQCDEKYEKIDPYLDIVIKSLDLIISNDSYVKMRRLAIRKIDGDNFATSEEADKVFEYFDQRITNFEKDRFWQRTYTDNFIYGKTEVRAHYSRTVKITPKEGELFVFILDIDTYLDSEDIKNERPSDGEFRDIFFGRLNEASFDLFKRGVKLEFLKSKLRKDEQE